MDAIQSKQTISNHAGFLSANPQQRFLAGVQHEIRTPFVGILGCTQYLLDSEQDPERKEVLQTLLTSNERLLNFFNQLITYAEVSKKNTSLSTSDTIDFRNILYQLKDLIKPTCNQKHILFAYYVNDDVPPLLYGDMNKIQQAIFYLINSFIARIENGMFYVLCQKNQLEQNKMRVGLHIQLTGLKLELSQDGSVFEPFSNESDLLEGNTDIKNTVLGFSIVKGYIEQLGGSIQLKKSPFILSHPFRKILSKDYEAFDVSQLNTQDSWECYCEFPLQIKPLA